MNKLGKQGGDCGSPVNLYILNSYTNEHNFSQDSGGPGKHGDKTEDI